MIPSVVAVDRRATVPSLSPRSQVSLGNASCSSRNFISRQWSCPHSSRCTALVAADVPIGGAFFPRSQTPFGTEERLTRSHGDTEVQKSPRSQVSLGNASCSPRNFISRSLTCARGIRRTSAVAADVPIGGAFPLRASVSPCEPQSASPRSQTPFGNALAEATPLPISASQGRYARLRAIELRGQFRSQIEFGNEENLRVSVPPCETLPDLFLLLRPSFGHLANLVIWSGSPSLNSRRAT